MGIGYRNVAQLVAITRFDEFSLDGSLLMLQDTQRFLCERDCEVALRRSEHQRLLGALPFEVGDVGGQFQLPTSREALPTDERLARFDHPATKRAMVD